LQFLVLKYQQKYNSDCCFFKSLGKKRLFWFCLCVGFVGCSKSKWLVL